MTNIGFMPLVTLIVPVYGVEKFIKRNVESLLSQSYDNCEFIFVDDASADNSLDIIKDTVKSSTKRANQVHIISHKSNQGLPAARNTGLEAATGDYIFHCDSDDWIEPTMIEDMVKAMMDQQADIVYSDIYLTFAKNERYLAQPSYEKPLDCIRAMLQGGMKYNVWNKLIKRSLYTENNIYFPAGRGMGEDMTIMKLFAHAKKVAYIPKAYYHYIQTNTNAFTKTFSQKHIDDVLYNAKDIETYLAQQYPGGELAQDFNFFKLNLKLPFLISLDKNMYDLWRAWFPETNKYIDTNPSFSFRIKLLQHAAVKEWDWVVRMYNLLIVKFIYGIIYK